MVVILLLGVSLTIHRGLLHQLCKIVHASHQRAGAQVAVALNKGHGRESVHGSLLPVRAAYMAAVPEGYQQFPADASIIYQFSAATRRNLKNF